ncbi:hypothetical protein Ahia01_000008700 [Argonauta hians]
MDSDAENAGSGRSRSRRRSSILKLPRSIDVDEQEQVVEVPKKSRRSSKRVSFANYAEVKEFISLTNSNVDTSCRQPENCDKDPDSNGISEIQSLLTGKIAQSVEDISDCENEDAMGNTSAEPLNQSTLVSPENICTASGKSIKIPNDKKNIDAAVWEVKNFATGTSVGADHSEKSFLEKVMSGIPLSSNCAPSQSLLFADDFTGPPSVNTEQLFRDCIKISDEDKEENSFSNSPHLDKSMYHGDHTIYWHQDDSMDFTKPLGKYLETFDDNKENISSYSAADQPGDDNPNNSFDKTIYFNQTHYAASANMNLTCNTTTFTDFLENPNTDEVTKSNPVELIRPNTVEVIRPNSVEIPKPNPIEVTRPNPIEVTKPNPVEVRPNPIEVTKPNPVKIRPSSVELTKPNAVEVTKPMAVEVTKPMAVEVTKPKAVTRNYNICEDVKFNESIGPSIATEELLNNLSQTLKEQPVAPCYNETSPSQPPSPTPSIGGDKENIFYELNGKQQPVCLKGNSNPKRIFGSMAGTRGGIYGLTNNISLRAEIQHRPTKSKGLSLSQNYKPMGISDKNISQNKLNPRNVESENNISRWQQLNNNNNNKNLGDSVNLNKVKTRVVEQIKRKVAPSVSCNEDQTLAKSISVCDETPTKKLKSFNETKTLENLSLCNEAPTVQPVTFKKKKTSSKNISFCIESPTKIPEDMTLSKSAYLNNEAPVAKPPQVLAVSEMGSLSNKAPTKEPEAKALLLSEPLNNEAPSRKSEVERLSESVPLSNKLPTEQQVAFKKNTSFENVSCNNDSTEKPKGVTVLESAYLNNEAPTNKSEVVTLHEMDPLNNKAPLKNLETKTFPLSDPLNNKAPNEKPASPKSLTLSESALLSIEALNKLHGTEGLSLSALLNNEAPSKDSEGERLLANISRSNGTLTEQPVSLKKTKSFSKNVSFCNEFPIKIPEDKTLPESFSLSQESTTKKPEVKKFPESVLLSIEPPTKKPEVEKLPGSVFLSNELQIKKPEIEKLPGSVFFSNELQIKKPEIEKLPESVVVSNDLPTKKPQVEKLPESVVSNELPTKKPQVEKLPESVVASNELPTKKPQVEKLPESVVSNELPTKKPQVEKLPESVVSNELPTKTPQVEKLPESVVVSNELPTEKPQVEKLPESVLLSNELPTEKPQVVKLPESVLLSNELPIKKPEVEKLPESVLLSNEPLTKKPKVDKLPQSVLLSNENPASCGEAKTLAENVSLPSEISTVNSATFTEAKSVKAKRPFFDVHNDILKFNKRKSKDLSLNTSNLLFSRHNGKGVQGSILPNASQISGLTTTVTNRDSSALECRTAQPDKPPTTHKTPRSDISVYVSEHFDDADISLIMDEKPDLLIESFCHGDSSNVLTERLQPLSSTQRPSMSGSLMMDRNMSTNISAINSSTGPRLCDRLLKNHELSSPELPLSLMEFENIEDLLCLIGIDSLENILLNCRTSYANESRMDVASQSIEEKMEVSCVLSPKYHALHDSYVRLKSEEEKQMKEFKDPKLLNSFKNALEKMERTTSNEDIKKQILAAFAIAKQTSKSRMKERKCRYLNELSSAYQTKLVQIETAYSQVADFTGKVDEQIEIMDRVFKDLDDKIEVLKRKKDYTESQLNSFKEGRKYLDDAVSAKREEKQLSLKCSQLASENAKLDVAHTKLVDSLAQLHNTPEQDALKDLTTQLYNYSLLSPWKLWEYGKNVYRFTFWVDTLQLSVCKDSHNNVLDIYVDIDEVWEIVAEDHPWLRLAHKMRPAILDERDSFKDCTDISHFTQLLSVFSNEMMKLEDLAREIHTVSIRNGLKFDNNSITVTFCSLKRLSKVLVTFFLDARLYPHAAINFQVDRKYGDISTEDLARRLRKVRPGFCYFSRLVQAVDIESIATG